MDDLIGLIEDLNFSLPETQGLALPPTSQTLAELAGVSAMLGKGPKVAGYPIFHPTQHSRPGALQGVHISKTAID